MDKFSVLVDADAQQMQQAHENLGSIKPSLIIELLEDAFDEIDHSIAHRLNDAEIRTIDRVDASKDNHHHVVEKEIVSGDAFLRPVTPSDSDGIEGAENFEAQYGIYAGMQGGELVYDDVEVVIEPK